MSNKLLSMFELLNKGYPINEFYAIDLRINKERIEQALIDGLRNFKSISKSRLMSIRTGIANAPENKLFLAPALNKNDDELIINEMKNALRFFSNKFGSYANGFIILQDWTPEEEYIFSINIAPAKNYFIIEAAHGNHSLIGREKIAPTIIKWSDKSIEVIKNQLNPNDLTMLTRLTSRLINKYILLPNHIYELSFTTRGPTFYQIKKPGELVKNPISKQAFYDKLSTLSINTDKRILKY